VHVNRVAVVAHAGKTVGGGLSELRTELARRGVQRPLWYEVPKSRKVPKRVQEALGAGAELVFAWGGDGTVQRCIDVMAGSDAKLAVVPAGTANLFASNLGIPDDIADAVHIGLHGATRTIDVGKMKGERFAVMAGAGLDARMIRDADGSLKNRLGRLAYVWTGLKGARSSTFGAKIEVDGVPWYEGEASLVLAGNLGKLFAGVEVFEDAKPDDGQLELGVVRAEGLVAWARTVARAAVGTPSDSPFVQQTRASTVQAELDRKVLYELDGGERNSVKRFRIDVEPAAIAVRVPEPAEDGK
jgi:diacylglycerol kinase (ATP)